MQRLIQSGWLFSIPIVFLGLQEAMGHDGWVEPHPTLVENGQIVTVSLMHGNHSNLHNSYRLAGKWEPQYTKLVVIDPSGKETDLTNQLVDLGEDEEKTGPKGPKGFHLAPFTAKEAGVYVIVARQERVLQFGQGPKFMSIRAATSTFAALPAPTVAAGRRLQGFQRGGGRNDALEIIPVTNPLGVNQGETVTLEVRYKGNPIMGKVVSIIGRIDGSRSAQLLGTDDHGRVAFTAGAPDFYLARVKFDEKNDRVEGQYDMSSYEATYVFQVFNRP